MLLMNRVFENCCTFHLLTLIDRGYSGAKHTSCRFTLPASFLFSMYRLRSWISSSFVCIPGSRLSVIAHVSLFITVGSTTHWFPFRCAGIFFTLRRYIFFQIHRCIHPTQAMPVPLFSTVSKLVYILTNLHFRFADLCYFYSYTTLANICEYIESMNLFCVSVFEPFKFDMC